MLIGFKALRATIAAIHGEGATSTALLGRFKYFQRMSFPGGSNVGRGARASYDLDQLLALSMAFELQETMAGPIRVVRLLRTSWPEISRGLAASWAVVAAYGGQALFAAHGPGGLEELGIEESADTPAPDPLIVVGPQELTDWIAGRPPTATPGLYVLDLARFVRRLRETVPMTAGVDVEAFDEAFRVFGADRFGTSDPSAWIVDRGPG